MLARQALDPIPGLPIDDRIMKAFIGMTLVSQPPRVDRVRQDLVQMPSADQPAAYALTAKISSNWQPDVLLIHESREPHDGANLEIAAKEIAHESGMLLDDMERPVLDPVAERNHTTHPDALLL
jgi:hypothetical protein